MIRTYRLMVLVGLGALLMQISALAPALAEAYTLGNNQRIFCGRGLSAGKLSTSTCKSYAYVFNTKTSEHFRCAMTLAMTRDNKEVLNVQTDGRCKKRARIFDEDSDYIFEATETEPPNTNSFFGEGGYAVWASDKKQPRIRGCIILNSGLGSELIRCLDMTFD